MSNLSAGKEILAYCGKCKLSLYHTIVVMKDDTTPRKVQCSSCKSTHAFKDQSVKPKKKKTTTRKKKVTIPNSEIWAEKLKDNSSTPIKYLINHPFIIGDIVDHPKFGIGIIEKTIDTNKVEVLFESEVKILMHNKK